MASILGGLAGLFQAPPPEPVSSPAPPGRVLPQVPRYESAEEFWAANPEVFHIPPNAPSLGLAREEESKAPPSPTQEVRATEGAQPVGVGSDTPEYEPVDHNVAQPHERIPNPRLNKEPKVPPSNAEIATWLSRIIRVGGGRIFQMPTPMQRVLNQMNLSNRFISILGYLGFTAVPEMGPFGFPTSFIIPHQYDLSEEQLRNFLATMTDMERLVIRYLLAVNLDLYGGEEPPTISDIVPEEEGE